MLKSVAFAAAVASATAFAPAAVGPATRGNTAVCANKFGQQAPAGAPAADLFNIWRDDYMVPFLHLHAALHSSRSFCGTNAVMSGGHLSCVVSVVTRDYRA